MRARAMERDLDKEFVGCPGTLRGPGMSLSEGPKCKGGAAQPAPPAVGDRERDKYLRP